MMIQHQYLEFCHLCAAWCEKLFSSSDWYIQWPDIAKNCKHNGFRVQMSFGDMFCHMLVCFDVQHILLRKFHLWWPTVIHREKRLWGGRRHMQIFNIIIIKLIIIKTFSRHRWEKIKQRSTIVAGYSKTSCCLTMYTHVMWSKSKKRSFSQWIVDHLCLDYVHTQLHRPSHALTFCKEQFICVFMSRLLDDVDKWVSISL